MNEQSWLDAEARRGGATRAQEVQAEQTRLAQQRADERTRERVRQEQEEWKRGQEALTQEAIDRELEAEKTRRKLEYFSSHPHGSEAGFEKLWKESLRPLLVEEGRQKLLEQTIAELRASGRYRF